MKVIATLPKKPKPEYDVSGLEPKRPTPAEAALVFLDEIEKNTVKAAESAAALLSLPETLTRAIESQTERLLPKPYPVTLPTNFAPVIESLQGIQNTIVMSTNRISTELSKVAQGYERVVEELKRIERPRKWKMEIDRNYTTREVQGVVLVADD